MLRISQSELIMWAVLFIVQILAGAGLGLGVYLSTQGPSTLVSTPPAAISVEHLAKLKAADKPLDSTRVGNLVDYCIGLENIINAHQRAGAEMVSRNTELTIVFIAVLILSVLLELTILAKRRRNAPA